MSIDIKSTIFYTLISQYKFNNIPSHSLVYKVFSFFVPHSDQRSTCQPPPPLPPFVPHSYFFISPFPLSHPTLFPFLLPPLYIPPLFYRRGTSLYPPIFASSFILLLPHLPSYLPLFPPPPLSCHPSHFMCGKHPVLLLLLLPSN